MKLLYFSALDEVDKKKCGILSKIKGQIRAFTKMGYNVSFGHFHGKATFVIESENTESVCIPSKGKYTRDRLGSIYDSVFEYIKDNEINIVYIRYTSLSCKAIDFYKKCKSLNITIVIEFYSHNLEVEAVRTIKRNIKNGNIKSGIKGLCSLLIDKFYFTKLKSCIDIIVTTTEVNSLYGINTINVVNGIDTDSVGMRTYNINEYDFNIISVAMISPWHGYDRAIRGIYEYYKNGGTLNILYTVIGDGEEKSNLEKLVNKLDLNDHVVFTGIKLQSELDKYYNEADIALEMLAGFRRTTGNISSIKMAEYFAKGIPVVYAADSRMYPLEIERYCYWVSNDDSALDIKGIIDYYNYLKKTRNNITREMHTIAIEQFDWCYTMRNLNSYLLKIKRKLV